MPHRGLIEALGVAGRAAYVAENLEGWMAPEPMTLELGGKCPAILADDSIDAESVKQVLGTKALKNAQMCISVDYCLVPRERTEELARLAVEHVRENMPWLLVVGEQHRHHHRAPPRAHPAPDRGRRVARL